MKARGGCLRSWLPVGLVAGLVMLGGCTGGSQPSDGSTSSSSTSATSSPTIDPRAQPAVDAYLRFTETSNNATRSPVPLGSTYPPLADFTRYSFDPIRSQYEGYVASLAAQQVTFRGTPPTQHVRLSSLRLTAQPYPTVVLTDCQTGSDWYGYDSAGHRLKAASASVAPPYLVTVKMIFYKSHWGVQSTTADTSRTCTA